MEKSFNGPGFGSGLPALEKGPDLRLRGLDAALGKIGLSAAPALKGPVELLYQGAEIAALLAQGVLIALAVTAGKHGAAAAAGLHYGGAELPDNFQTTAYTPIYKYNVAYDPSRDE